MKTRLADIAGALRWKDWYDSKGACFGMAFYLGLVHLNSKSIPWAVAGGLAIHIAAFMSFGYAINDHADRMADRAASKKRPFGDLTPHFARISLLVLFLFGMAGLWPCRHVAPAALWLGLLNYALAAAYSVAPFRFKEAGEWGVLTAAAIQRPLPAAVVALSMQGFVAIIPWLAVWMLLGLRTILVHQLLDYNKDLQTGIRTFATTQGPERVQRLLRKKVLASEAVALATSVAFFLPGPVALGSALGYFGWTLLAGSRDRNRRIISYSEAPLMEMHLLFLPMALAVYLGAMHVWLWWLPALEVLWKWRYLKEHCWRYCLSPAPDWEDSEEKEGCHAVDRKGETS